MCIVARDDGLPFSTYFKKVSHARIETTFLKFRWAYIKNHSGASNATNAASCSWNHHPGHDVTSTNPNRLRDCIQRHPFSRHTCAICLIHLTLYLRLPAADKRRRSGSECMVPRSLGSLGQWGSICIRSVHHYLALFSDRATGNCCEHELVWSDSRIRHHLFDSGLVAEREEYICRADGEE